jgi:Fe-S cluster assembly protein SufB
MAATDLDLDLGRYKLGWSDAEDYVFKPKRGLTEDIIKEMSWMKGEPDWMREYRLTAYKHFLRRPMPNWGGDMSEIFFDDIFYYIKPTDHQVDAWDELPDSVKETYEKLGIPEAERKYLAGVTAQYESEVVYHKNREDLEAQGVIFTDMDTALREYPELVRAYFGTVIPKNDNKFAALNSSVWSGGSFIYVPPGVNVEMPLQAYFRINAENMGQFERTLIIADEGSSVHYIEGCSAPVYTTDSLHSAVVEIVVKPSARVTYTTIQNWSNNVFNLVTKRARVEAEGHMEWIDGNIGSRLTMKYPAVYMVGPKASAPRWSTPPPRPPRRSSPSRSPRTAAAPPTAASSGSRTTPTAARATCSATPSSSTTTPSRTPSPTWRSAPVTPSSATRPPCRRSPTSSSSTS